MIRQYNFPVQDAEAEAEAVRVSTNAPVHRIFCVDCSGSMSSDLPLIRTQLKNKIPTCIRAQDFMSLIWFSGSSQCGTIFEHISIKDLNDIGRINDTIDRFLRPQGLTGFVEPIRLAKNLADKYGEVAQVFFLSDGGENCNPIDNTYRAFRELNQPLVVVEYSYYCDRKLLQELAELGNGQSVFNEDFERFNTSFESYMRSRVFPSGANNFNEVDSAVDAFVFDEDSSEITIFKSENGKVKVPKEIKQVFFAQDAEDAIENPDFYYLGMAYACKTKKVNLLTSLAERSGDVNLIGKVGTCFSKQDFSMLYDTLVECIKDPAKRYLKGCDVNFRVNENIFTLIDLLYLLNNDEKARFYPYNSNFKYKRISREVKDDSGVKFVPNKDLGSSFELVFHQSRANVSIGCKVLGHEIDSEGDIKPISTYRNYAVIKDGIKNVTILPVSVSDETFASLKAQGLVPVDIAENPKILCLNIMDLPIVNQAFAKASSSNLTAANFFGKQVNQLMLKAQMKFVKSMQKRLAKAAVAGDEEEGDGAAYKRKAADPNAVRDFYNAPELQVKIAKCSTLPTVNDKLLDKLTKTPQKCTMSEALYLGIFGEYQAVGDADKEAWCTTKLAQLKVQSSVDASFLELCKMAILLAGRSFTDRDASDTSAYNVTVNGTSYSCTLEINDIKVYLD